MILAALLLLQSVTGQPGQLSVPCTYFAPTTGIGSPRTLVAARLVAQKMHNTLRLSQCTIASGQQPLPKFSTRFDNSGALMFIVSEEVEESLSSHGMEGLAAHELGHTPQDYDDKFWASLTPIQHHQHELAADARAALVVGAHAVMTGNREYGALFESTAQRLVAAMRLELQDRGIALRHPAAVGDTR